MIFIRVGPLGPLREAFPFRKYRHRVPGLPTVFGGIFLFPLPMLHKCPMLLDLTFLHSVLPSGQLSNIYAISDPTLLKQALLQVIHAMRCRIATMAHSKSCLGIIHAPGGGGPSFLDRLHTVGHKQTECFSGRFSSNSDHNTTNTTQKTMQIL